jgi:SAM-dependent methyltransferase
MPKKQSKAKSFDKYFYYVNSVQSASHDAELLSSMYKKHGTSKLASLCLQEDFCGTADLCYEWVQLNKKYKAIGIDLDKKALAWGKNFHSDACSDDELNRIDLVHGDVLTPRQSKPDIICALNFSYSFLHSRAGLLNYLKKCHRSLNSGGLTILDCFGGPAYLKPHLDKRRNTHDKFTFWWEVKSFDAISNRISCAIHFQADQDTYRKDVFTYEWRLWSVPEITDIFKEAGFSEVHYWSEGLDVSGKGDGKFKVVKKEANCEAWVCYLVAKK